MTPFQLASLIPAEYRKEILLTNMISKAQASTADPNSEGAKAMSYIFTVWKNYVEPTACNTCPNQLNRVLNNYKGLQEVFIQMEKEAELLNAGI